MQKTKLREKREILAQQRRRNAIVLKVLAPLMFLVLVLVSAVIFSRGLDKLPARVAPWFPWIVGIQGTFNLILVIIALLMPRTNRHYASRLMFLFGVVLVIRQSILLHLNPEHSMVVLVVVLAGLGMLFQMRLAGGVVYLGTLYIAAAVSALSGDFTPVPFFPATLGGPVLGIMMLFIQNRITKQTLRIREQTAALARSNKENLSSLTEVRSLKGEQDRILQTVREGLFLIDSDLRVGSQYSAALPEILGRENIAGVNVAELFKDGYAEDVRQDLEKYLRLMFRPALRESNLAQLNPLNEVRVLMDSTSSGEPSEEKYLVFRFSRVYTEKKITRLMATVQDITARKKLEETVAQREQEAGAQMELLFSLIHVEPVMLHQFLEEIKSDLDQINSMFREAGDKREMLSEMFRRMHSIKGNASVLNLEVFAERGHEFEELIKKLNEKEKLQGGDFLPLTLKLTDLHKLVEEVEELIGRLLQFQEAFKGEDHDIRRLLTRSLEQMIERISGDLEKNVRLDDTNFDPLLIPVPRIALVREALVQMTRNSMVHGIEPPGERTSGGKAAQGVIGLSTESENGVLVLTIRDDGRGLQMDAIKKRAMTMGSWSAAQLDAMSSEQLTALIFQPGFSTSEKSDLNSGRGVGLDLVKTSLGEIQGGVTVTSSPGEFCEFRIAMQAN